MNHVEQKVKIESVLRTVSAPAPYAIAPASKGLLGIVLLNSMLDVRALNSWSRLVSSISVSCLRT